MSRGRPPARHWLFRLASVPAMRRPAERPWLPLARLCASSAGSGLGGAEVDAEDALDLLQPLVDVGAGGAASAMLPPASNVQASPSAGCRGRRRWPAAELPFGERLQPGVRRGACGATQGGRASPRPPGPPASGAADRHVGPQGLRKRPRDHNRRLSVAVPTPRNPVLAPGQRPGRGPRTSPRVQPLTQSLGQDARSARRPRWRAAAGSAAHRRARHPATRPAPGCARPGRRRRRPR